MFKVPNNLPTKNASVEEFTDFIEWECIKNERIAVREVLRPILFINDEINFDGIEDEGDMLLNKIDDVLAEMDRRNKASNNKYPFITKNKGYTVEIKSKGVNYWIYSYLLLSTRLDMKKNKIFSSIDGTEILEHLSSLIAKEYFGERTESEVFGTAAEMALFEDRVNFICQRIGEGHSFLNRNNNHVRAQDDKLDIVVWKNFSDGNKSKLIGFGQCKTGTSWDDQATIELQPRDFCERWMMDTPIHSPLKMFFSSQYFPLDFYSKAKNAGIVFDRFRILDYVPRKINGSLLNDIANWTSQAIEFSKSI
ncbi:MAG: hypothetical protein ACRDE8_09475 [Ginsengibacter sp.]